MLSVNTKIANIYYMLIKNLDSDAQLDIVKKIFNSLSSDKSKSHQSINHLFGAWKGNETAEELSKSVIDSRKFNRKTVEF